MPLLTPYTEEHDTQTVEWLNNPALRETFGLTYSLTLEGHRQWVAKQDGLVLRAIEYEGEHIGNILLKLIPQHAKACLEVYIGSTGHQGKGLGRQALREMLAIGFGEYELNRIYLVTRTGNQVAERLYRAAGFVLEGCEREAIRDGDRFVDQNLWAILRSEWVRDGGA